MENKEFKAVPLCFFCNKSEDEAELTDMETNSIKCGEEIIEYEDLLTEVFSMKISPGLICSDCQNQILTFYCFKSNVNLSQEAEGNVRREIKRKLDMFLDDLEDPAADLVVLRYNQCFAVVPNSKRELMQNFQSWQPRVHLQKVEEKTTAGGEKDDELIENEEVQLESTDFTISEIDENIYDEIIVEDGQEHYVYEISARQELEMTEMIEEEQVDDGPPMPKKHKPSQEQREWVNDTVKTSYGVQESEAGVVPIWNCPLCVKVFVSAQAIRLHLLAKHLTEENDSLTDDIRDWIRRESRERRILIETLEGNKFQWACGICDFACVTSKTFRTHLIESHIQNKKPIKASSTVNATSKSYHQKQWIQSQIKHDNEEDSWSCLKCKQSFRSEKTLRSHLLEHTSQLTSEDFKEAKVHRTPSLKKNATKTQSARWTCKECWFQFAAQRSFDSHMKLHETLQAMNPFTEVHHCKECNMFFRSIEDLTVHIDGHSEGVAVLVHAEGIALQKTILFKRLPLPTEASELSECCLSCGHCGKKVEGDINCKSHLLLHHVNPLVCPKDGRQFNAMQPYLCHLQKVHSEMFPASLLCTHCKMPFDNIYSRLAHMKHCQEKKFICDHCDKKFSNKNYLSSHLKREMGLLSCSCQLCGKNFKAKDEMKIHMRSHTKEKPFQCSMCEKRYTTTSARASHMEIHKDTLIQCEVCEVKFVARRHYVVHYKRYHDEAYRQRQFLNQTCQHCAKQFLRKDRLREHLLKAHGLP